VDPDAVAAWDVASVIIPTWPDVDNGRPFVNPLPHLVCAQPRERRRGVPDERNSAPVDRGHVAVVGRVAVLTQRTSQERHHLGDLKERIGVALVTQRRLMAAPSARAAERAAAM